MTAGVQGTLQVQWGASVRHVDAPCVRRLKEGVLVLGTSGGPAARPALSTAHEAVACAQALSEQRHGPYTCCRGTQATKRHWGALTTVPAVQPPCGTPQLTFVMYPPPCAMPSGCCSFTGPWTVTRSSLRMLRRVAAFCRPLRPVLSLVSLPRSRSPVVSVPGLC